MKTVYLFRHFRKCGWDFWPALRYAFQRARRSF